MRVFRVVAVLVSAGLLATVGVLAYRQSGGELPGGEPFCEASVDGQTVRLDPTQARFAAQIAAIGMRRGLPARAVTIALAAAYQESKITNPRYGDRDSQGIFQQRPSQGWGTLAQVRDPRYATESFYSALEQVDGYTDLPVDEAAQAVQRSADGSAYAQHETSARVLASALTGYSPAALSCVVEEPVGASDQRLRPNGLTAAADAVRRQVAADFGMIASGGYAPGGVTTGHSAGSAHYDGRAIDYFFRPVDAENTRRGWALAQYLVANARRLEVATVIFDDRIWTARRSGEGWREYDPGVTAEDPGTQAVLRHLDHVHVDVA